MASGSAEDPRRKQRPFWQRALPVAFVLPLVGLRLGWQTALVLLAVGVVGGVVLKYAPIPAWKPKEGDVFPVSETPFSMVAFIVVWLALTLGLAVYLKSHLGW